MTENVKLVIVGEKDVGKYCLEASYSNNSFPDDYRPTVSSDYKVAVLHKNKYLSLGIWQTAPGKECEKLRPLSYPETDVFVICFSLVDPSSLASIPNWVCELREQGPSDVPLILVGTKLDLRDSVEVIRELHEKDTKPVTTEEGNEMCKKMSLDCYLECSAKTQVGLKEVFMTAIALVVDSRSEKNMTTRDGEKCNVM